MSPALWLEVPVWRRQSLKTDARRVRMPPKPTGPYALEDPICVACSGDDDHSSRGVIPALRHDAGIHRLVARRGDGLVNSRHQIDLDAEHDIALYSLAILLRLRMDDTRPLRGLFRPRAEELQNLGRHEAGAETREAEREPDAQGKTQCVQHHAAWHVDASNAGKKQAEEDPRESQPGEHRAQDVLRSGQHRCAQAAPKPVHVDVDAHARNTPREGGDFRCQELTTDLDGEALDDAVKDPNACKHQGAALAEAAPQRPPRVRIG
mmetsp:Transcript_111050/g.313194  ORF Transcript_111050/g.313194 Transcript_111050/m.313194 type:complete len:264 (-) Transcript_111050:1060-1851(-)